MACLCEDQSQSLHPSPGLVSSDESLIRLAFRPEMIDGEGRLKNSAIPKAELQRQVDGEAPNRGCSVFRDAHINPNDLKGEAARLCEGREQRKSAWLFRCATSDIRALLASDGDRSLCVVDRAEPNNHAHAELWGGRAGRSPAALKNIRDQLISHLMPIDQII